MARRRTWVLLTIIVLFALALWVLLPIDGERLGRKGIQFGLDLQGGVRLVYKADLSDRDPADWDAVIDGVRYYSEHTGDNEYVPINTVLNYSFLGKLSFQLASNLKLSLMGTWNYDERPTTGHQYKYKPDGELKP